MSDEAKELRVLARKIEELVQISSMQSAVWEQVRSLCDYLTLRARVIELTDDLRKHELRERM